MAETINPNVSTADITPEPTIAVSGGDTAVSFDELEAVDRYHETVDKSEKATAKKEAKAAKPSDKKEPHGRESERGDGTEGGSEEEESDSKKQQAPEKKDTAKAKDAKAEKPRVVKVKAGDQELDLDLGAKIPVTIEGKPGEATLEELRNNYAGQVAWSARFSKLENEKQQFMKSKSVLDSEFKEILELGKQDGLQAMMRLAELYGHDPLQWRKNFVNSTLPALEKFLSMSEHERAAADLEVENHFLRSRQESQRAKTQEEQGFAEFQARVQTLQQTHQVDSETFAETFYELERLQKAGELKVKDITPEVVIETIRNERLYDGMEKLFAELKIQDEATLDQAFRHMADIAKKNPEFSVADLQDIAREVWGKQKAVSLSRKIAQSKPEAVSRQQRRPANPGHEALTFDDL